MTLQHGESRLDRVEVVLVPGVEVMAQARRFVRRFMESSGAQSETTERMVQLVAELLGRGPSRSPRPWKRSPPRCVSPSSSGHLLTTPLCSGGGRSIHWGTRPWRLYVSRLSDDWQERPHLGGVLITVHIRDRLSTTAPASANMVDRPL
jgi:hypothetical protein